VTKTFRDLGVAPALCDALEAQGIVHPFPIQELTLPLALDGHDLIGQARTGTGKTLAFGLPLLQRLDPEDRSTQALVVVPTRELCVQVHDDLSIGESLGLTTVSVYGGTPYEAQTEALREGVHVVVGTPGRLLDHLDRRNLDLSKVKVLVLDEADEMLDMGFLPDVERLIQATPADGRHTMLFSATMPTAIVKMARRYLTHPTFTRADAEEHETAPNVEQHFFSVHRMDKPRVLARILQTPDRGGVYVFVRTKHMADRLVNELDQLGVAAIPIHGDLRQTAREKNLERFRSGEATVLVATEVAARGLDVSGVTHVVNYDCPDDEKMYLHRIGRTARAGEAGVAVTFAEFNEVDRLNVIRKAVGADDAEIVPVFSTSELLDERFDLPEEKPWDHLARRRGDRRGDGGRARGSDRERDEGRRPPRERQGRSDGKPKSRRASEGSGGDHDADRSPRRSRAGQERDEREAAPAARTRTRTRTRARGTAADGRAEDRARQPRRERTGAEGRGDAARTPDRGTEARDDRSSRSSDDRGSRDRDRNGGRDRDRNGDRDRGGGGRDRDRRERGQGGGRKRADRRDRDERSGRGDRAGEPRTEPRGRRARGEGAPQLARRVKVEHLP
jgi:superfamily II DNA/RNA helicase